MTSPHFSEPVLSVRNLEVSFPSEAGTVHAVRGIDCDLRPGQTLAIVGESGSGKSVTAMAIMGLLPEYAKVSGTVTVNGQSLLDLSDEQMFAVRGKQIGMIFQDPLSALTPVFDVGTQISEALLIHNTMTSQQAWNRAVELLGVVGIPDPERRAKSFPHEFSGGMRQRVLIAIAIANNPAVLIADEPTTALDVTIQAQILDLIKVAQQETQAATIMITHDMGVVAEMADEVIVMYAGRPIERGSVFDIFTTPRMPYTIGLLGSIPSLSAPKGIALTTIPGNPPKVIDLPEGCSFAPRCPIATDVCTTSEPFLNDVAQGHKAACHRAQDIAQGQVPATAIFPTPELPQDIFAGVSLQERSTVLNVEHLTKTFPLMKGGLLKRRVGSVYAVDDVSFSIKEGECFAIVGESGSGKTTTLLEIMDLQPEEETSITLRGEDVSGLTSRQRTLKRRDIQIVFQDPMGALDPRLTVEDILREPLDALGWEGDKDARIVELLELVGIDPQYTPNSTDGYKHITSVSKGATAKEAKVVFDMVYPWWQSIISVAHPALENPKNYQDYVKKVHPEWGAGPYTVGSIDFNKGEAVFVRNDKWWGKKGKLDKRIFRQMDSMASLNAFKNGEIDTTGAHLRERYAAVKNMNGVEIKRGKNPALVLLELNAASPVLQDVKVRKAIATALDRAQLAKIWYNGLDGYYQDPEGSFVLHSFQPGYEDNFSKVATFDPAQANALLDEAGWTSKNEEGIRTKDGKTLTVRYLLVGDAQTGKDQAAATQKMLKDVGVDLSIESRTSADFSSIVSNRDFDILPLQFVSNSPDGVAFFEQTYGSTSELNKSGTGTKALDAKIAHLQKLPTREEQIARANELEPEALATFGLIPLQSSAAMTIQKEGLANVGQTTFHVVYPELVGWKK